jgi:hypothetical protein
VEYADGNCFQIIALNFEAAIINGEIRLSDETIDIRYFLLTEIENMELVLDHKQRILDALTGKEAAVIR